MIQSVLCLINLTLAATNLLGYYKCKGGTFIIYPEHNKKINNLKNEMMAKGIKTFFSGKWPPQLITLSAVVSIE